VLFLIRVLYAECGSRHVKVNFVLTKEHVLWYIAVAYVYILYLFIVGSDSSVGIATSYGLDCQGIETLWGRDFLNPSRPAMEPTQPPIQWVPVLFHGG
jgi:hypothetical protein